jgi:multiple sugar transport system substrate-binding protein
MIRDKALLILLSFVCLFHSWFLRANEALHFGVSISNSKQREAFYTLGQRFESNNPGVTIQFTSFTSEIYKQKFPKLVSSDGYDVLYWHAGERMFEHIEAGEILAIEDEPLNALIQTEFDQSAISAVSKGSRIYGLPISYYQLGFYYNKPLFAQLGLSEPDNWQSFLTLCQALKKASIPPIYVGTESNWPATAWFDYLNLRLNGLAFHLRLVKGQESFLDERVERVFQALKPLIQSGYFIEKSENLE